MLFIAHLSSRPNVASQAGRMRGCRRAVSLIECIVLMVVFSIISVAAGVGLQSVARSPSGDEAQVWTSQQIISKMESLHDTPYASLASGTATSDADHNNITYTITWTVTCRNRPRQPHRLATRQSPKAGSGLKQIVMSMNGQTVTTWISQ